MNNDIFSLLITIIETIIMVLFIYQFIYVLVAIFKKSKQYRAHSFHKYAFIICARDEEGVIANLIKSIHAQDYPSDYYRIFVVADNCTDGTASAAKKAGAVVYERFNEEEKGKGYAIRYLLSCIERNYGPDEFEAFIVFDADNLLDKRYLREMNKLFDNGFEIITSFRNSKNYGSNWISSCTGLWFIKEAKLMNNPRFSMGISCTVSGTGYLVSAEVLRSVGGWNYFLLTEDMEFSIDCITSGRKIAYCDKAIFFDEQPIRFADSWNQRMRWAKGFYQVLGKYGGKLFKQMFTKPSFSCYDQIIILSPGYMFLFGAVLVFVLMGLHTGFIQPDFSYALAWHVFTLAIGAYVMFFLMGLVTTLMEWKHIYAPSFRKILYLFTFPVFIFTYIPLAVIALFIKVKWKKINHTINIDNDRMENSDY